jgi:hypothetical protein
MNSAEWALLIGTIALLVGPLAAIKAASKIREYRRKQKDDADSRSGREQH